MDASYFIADVLLNLAPVDRCCLIVGIHFECFITADKLVDEKTYGLADGLADEMVG